MSDEDAIEALETDPGLKDLALGAFTAIHEESVFIMHHHLGWQVAAHGRRGGGGTEEY